MIIVIVTSYHNLRVDISTLMVSNRTTVLNLFLLIWNYLHAIRDRNHYKMNLRKRSKCNVFTLIYKLVQMVSRRPNVPIFSAKLPADAFIVQAIIDKYTGPQWVHKGKKRKKGRKCNVFFVGISHFITNGQLSLYCFSVCPYIESVLRKYLQGVGSSLSH